MFTTQQQLVLDLISEGQNIGQAAQAIGVHRNTVCNWRRNSVAYQYAWDLAHYDQVMLARDRAAGLAYDAISTLNDIMGNHHHPPGARIRAAIAILQRAETMPPAAPQPPPGYSSELPIPQSYSPEDHAPAKHENLAQSAQPAAAPDPPEIPLTPDLAATCTPAAAEPPIPPVCTTEPAAQPRWPTPAEDFAETRAAFQMHVRESGILSRIGPLGEGNNTRENLKALSSHADRTRSS